MSYSEDERGQVVLTMSREDYDGLLLAFAICTSTAQARGFFGVDAILELLNRLNQGNPDYIPYQVEVAKK